MNAFRNKIPVNKLTHSNHRAVAKAVAEARKRHNGMFAVLRDNTVTWNRNAFGNDKTRFERRLRIQQNYAPAQA